MSSSSSSSSSSDLVAPNSSLPHGRRPKLPISPPYPQYYQTPYRRRYEIPNNPPPQPKIPNPPPFPILSSSVRNRFRTTLIPPQPNFQFPDIQFPNDYDIEANLIPHPVEPVAVLIPPNPNPIEPHHIVLPNHNLVAYLFARAWILIAYVFARVLILVDRIKIFTAYVFARVCTLVLILVDRIKIYTAYVFVRVCTLVNEIYARVCTLVNEVKIFTAYVFARVCTLVNEIRILIADLFTTIRIFFADLYANILASKFVRYLVKRTEEFRPVEGPHVMKDRFVQFQSNSTQKNDKLWRFFKWCYVVNVWLMTLCLFAGACYWKFGEGSGTNPKSFRFKDESAIIPVVAVGFFSTVLYGFWAYHYWNELNLFKVRSIYIGFLALDIICDLRSVKAVALTYYGFYDFAKEYGCWTDLIFVGFPVFYSIGSISMLILFQHEFYHAHGLLNDFIVIFVGPMIIQFAHRSYLNVALYAIPIVFGRLSQLLGYIYRPHVTNDFYDPTTPIPPADEI